MVTSLESREGRATVLISVIRVSDCGENRQYSTTVVCHPGPWILGVMDPGFSLRSPRDDEVGGIHPQ